MHANLLHLPYFWDEAGYYVPAALDFYRRWTLIPTFTNAHPPLPNVVLAMVWHAFGFHILVTRLIACAFAAAALLAAYELAQRLLGASLALALAGLCAVYPIWYVQSSLVHADIFAAAFTLGGFALYLTAPELQPADPATPSGASSPRRLVWAAVLFSLAALSKETSILQPAALFTAELWYVTRARTTQERHAHLRWLAVLGTPLPLLATWFGYHRLRTGFTFGNPEFLRYNATANLSVAHIASSLWYRFLHLFWQRNIWLPIVLACACLFLRPRSEVRSKSLSPRLLRTIALLLCVNWLAFSILGGALLTRYLLPMYPLLLLVCLRVWQSRTALWPALAALAAAGFLSALWFNPPTYFAPEDNLTYRDMIVVHQDAIAYLERHNPNATVLTAWPASAELTRPDLGYTDHPFHVFPIEDFQRGQIATAAEHPGNFGTALVFSVHYIDPGLRRWLGLHPASASARKFAATRDLSAAEIARALGGDVAWSENRDGEWAAVLRFQRRYDAQQVPPARLNLPADAYVAALP